MRERRRLAARERAGYYITSPPGLSPEPGACSPEPEARYGRTIAAMAEFKLVEACSGVGDLVQCEGVPHRVRYRFDRYQGMMAGTGLPIPGLHRIVGSIALPNADGAVPPELVGSNAVLRLEDGRGVPITVVGADGSILAEGHGPGRGCSCC